MSLLTPERVPVKVYRWDDAGAPQLDKSPGCVATIFKACLAIGYSDKDSAGWTMPFEDAAAGVKVLRPEVGTETDFYLRLSADTGTAMIAQVYLNMTDVNVGDLKLQCDTAFKYAKKTTSGKWVLIATPRSFWFVCEQTFSGNINKSGSYFFAGDTASDKDGLRAIALTHSGGSQDVGSNSGLLQYEALKFVTPKAYSGSKNTVATPTIISLFDSRNRLTSSAAFSPLYLVFLDMLYALPGVFASSSGTANNNFDIVSVLVSTNLVDYMVLGTAGSGDSNFYFNIDAWVY